MFENVQKFLTPPAQIVRSEQFVQFLVLRSLSGARDLRFASVCAFD
jgi:hypothetical protein